MSRRKDPESNRLDRFLMKLPVEFCYYVRPYNHPGKYYGFRSIVGARAYRDGTLRGNGDVYKSKTREQVA